MAENTIAQENAAKDVAAEALRERMEKAAIADLQGKILQQISIVKNLGLPPTEEGELLAKLERAFDGNVSAADIAVILTSSQVATTKAQIMDALEMTIQMAELQEMYGVLSNDEIRRVMTRSAFIDLKDAKSVGDFAEAMVDSDIPTEMRHEVVKDVSRMIASPEMKPVMEAHNNASREAKIIENARVVHTEKLLKAAKNDPVFKDNVGEAVILGSALDGNVQKAMDDHRQGKKTSESANEDVGKGNKVMRQRVVDRLAHAKQNVDSEIVSRAEALGSDQQIVDRAIAILKSEKTKGLSPNDAAAVRLFYVAKAEVAVRYLTENVVARDLASGKGTPEERIQRATDVLRNHTNGEFKYFNDEQLKSIAASIITNVDERKITFDQLRALNKKDEKSFIQEAVTESQWGGMLDDIEKNMSKGADAMLAGNKEATQKSAHMTGLTIESRLIHGGTNKEVAKMAGQAVGSGLEVAGVVGVTAVQAARASGAVGVATDLMESTGAGAAIASGVDIASAGWKAATAKVSGLFGDNKQKIETAAVKPEATTPAPSPTPPGKPAAEINAQLRR